MKVLIVGAGAVGQVYGSFLQRGGATVAVYIKPRHVEAARAAYRVHRRHGRRRSTEYLFRPAEILTSPTSVRAKHWDQVWLCVPSDALVGPWLPELLGAIGNAVVVNMVPGLEDRARITRHYPESRVIDGVTALAA
jgi:2-dehydropantoate 2-reductase